MKDLLLLLAHLLTTITKLLWTGGARTIVADSLLMKQQLLVINRSRRRAQNLSALDRFLFGFWSLFLNPRRIQISQFGRFFFEPVRYCNNGNWAIVTFLGKNA
jgi:hypothetical protein